MLQNGEIFLITSAHHTSALWRRHAGVPDTSLHVDTLVGCTTRPRGALPQLPEVLRCLLAGRSGQGHLRREAGVGDGETDHEDGVEDVVVIEVLVEADPGRLPDERAHRDDPADQHGHLALLGRARAAAADGEREQRQHDQHRGPPRR